MASNMSEAHLINSLSVSKLEYHERFCKRWSMRLLKFQIYWSTVSRDNCHTNSVNAVSNDLKIPTWCLILTNNTSSMWIALPSLTLQPITVLLSCFVNAATVSIKDERDFAWWARQPFKETASQAAWIAAPALLGSNLCQPMPRLLGASQQMPILPFAQR